MHRLSNHSQSHTPAGDAKANAWSSFQRAEIDQLQFKPRAALLSYPWEKLRAALGDPSSEYKAARTHRDGIKSARDRWLGDLRQQLLTYLGSDAIDLLDDSKKEAEPVRKLLRERTAQDIRSLPNHQFQAYISSLRTARDFCEELLRSHFDQNYRENPMTNPVSRTYVNMALHFILEDLLRDDPAMNSRFSNEANRRASESKSEPAFALNQLRRRVLEQVRSEVSKDGAQQGKPFTHHGLKEELQKVLVQLCPLQSAGSPQALAKPGTVASAAIDLDASSFTTSNVKTQVEVPLDFKGAQERVAKYLSQQPKFNAPEFAVKKAALLKTLDKMIAQKLDKARHTILPSKAIKLAKDALKEYTDLPKSSQKPGAYK